MYEAWPTSYTCIAAQDTPNWFPARFAAANLAYGFSIADAVTPNVDYIASVAVAVAPSGSGEMVPAALSVIGYNVTILPIGGQPGRVYTYSVVATMKNGNRYLFIIQQGTSKVLQADTPQVAPSPEFGSEITWMAGTNNVATTALAANLVIAAYPCALANIQANTTTVGGYVMLFDSATVPADGAVVPIRIWQVPGSSTLPPQTFNPPLSMANGAALAFSSNANQFILTSSATAFLAGELAI